MNANTVPFETPEKGQQVLGVFLSHLTRPDGIGQGLSSKDGVLEHFRSMGPQQSWGPTSWWTTEAPQHTALCLGNNPQMTGSYFFLQRPFL